MEHTPKKQSKSIYGLCIFALVTLFNPNINLIDILPDFIGFFILAAVFEKAALFAPYFEEARGAFIKLGCLSLAKIPALLLILSARSSNTSDNDIVALLSMVFAIFELILLIIAINHIFNALFYLGQRSDAKALITAEGGMKSPEDLKLFTVIFAIAKCVIYALPEFLKLTRIVDSSTVVTGSYQYPYVMIGAQVIGFALGAIWLSFMIKYLRAVKKEGEFHAALDSLRSQHSEGRLEELKRRRSLFRTYSLFTVSSFFTMDLCFDNFSDVNLLPHFLFGTLFSIALFRLIRKTDSGKGIMRAFIAVFSFFTLFSVLFYIFQTNFLTEYGYATLYESKLPAATASYLGTVIFGALEFVFYTALFVLFFITAKRYLLGNLGIRPDSQIYSKQDRDYHKSLLVKSGIFTALGILAGLTKLIGAILYFNPKMIDTESTNLGIPTVLSPAIPWFGLVTAASTIAFILYALYYFGTLKEEEDKD